MGYGVESVGLTVKGLGFGVEGAGV